MTNRFAKKLKEFRKKAEPGQIEFSKKIGVTQSTMSHLESGKRLPSADFISKLKASFPDIPVQDLVEAAAADKEERDRIKRASSDEKQILNMQEMLNEKERLIRTIFEKSEIEKALAAANLEIERLRRMLESIMPRSGESMGDKK